MISPAAQIFPSGGFYSPFTLQAYGKY